MGKLKKQSLTIERKNDNYFNLMKSIEELNELSLALVQSITKSHTSKPISKQEIIDEIGDVKRKIWLLESIYGKKNVKKRIKNKINQLKNK